MRSIPGERKYFYTKQTITLPEVLSKVSVQAEPMNIHDSVIKTLSRIIFLSYFRNNNFAYHYQSNHVISAKNIYFSAKDMSSLVN